MATIVDAEFEMVSPPCGVTAEHAGNHYADLPIWLKVGGNRSWSRVILSYELVAR